MTFKSHFDHSEPIFNELQILNLHKINVNDYLTSLFMFRYLHLQNLPELFTSYFFTNKEIHNHNTRNSSLLHKKSSRTNYAKHTLANKGIEVWNNLSEQYKKQRSYDSFKKLSKTTSYS
jgi:hypothetical protein